jgi:tRNA(Ile)-lysidine synthase
VLVALLPAVRARALKRWAEGRTGRAVTAVHVGALRALVERWHGQGPVVLPGGTAVERREGRLACRRD